MIKSIILSLLLVFVYQFDELARGVHAIWSRIRHKRYHRLAADTDHYVGTALTIALMPLFLNYALASDGALAPRLIFLFGVYFTFALLMTGVGRFMHELGKSRRYHGITMLIAGGMTIGRLFVPNIAYVPWDTGRERMTYARLAFLLSIPPLLGLVFRAVYGAYSYEGEVLKYFDALIIVMIGGLFMNIIIHALERYFTQTNLGMMGYFRIVAGIGVALFLLF
jgi:hypothetical protein